MAKAACHLGRHTVRRDLKDAGKLSDWEGQLKDLQGKHQRFERFADALEREGMDEYKKKVEKLLEEQKHRAQKIAEDIDNMTRKTRSSWSGSPPWTS